MPFGSMQVAAPSSEGGASPTACSATLSAGFRQELPEVCGSLASPFVAAAEQAHHRERSGSDSAGAWEMGPSPLSALPERELVMGPAGTASDKPARHFSSAHARTAVFGEKPWDAAGRHPGFGLLMASMPACGSQRISGGWLHPSHSAPLLSKPRPAPEIPGYVPVARSAPPFQHRAACLPPLSDFAGMQHPVYRSALDYMSPWCVAHELPANILRG